MKIQSISFSPDDEDANGISTVASTTGTILALNGALIADGAYTADIPRPIIFGSTANNSGVTLTLTGTDRFGNSWTEDVTGPAADAITTTTGMFATVTQIAISGDTTALYAGTNDEFESEWKPLDPGVTPFNVSNAVIVTGTINYTVQHTFDDMFNSTTSKIPFNHDTIASKTSNEDSNYAFPCSATRLKVNSFSSGATIRYNWVQAG